MLFRKRQKRVAVIGLDGVPYSLVASFCQQGILPQTAAFTAAGRLHQMRASLPEISAVSWTDFMTGTNSGTHGIFGFTDLKANSYDLRFPNFYDVRTPTIWERLNHAGKKCVVINQPATYPARPLKGVLISGFVAIDLAKAVYPPKELERLKKLNYVIDVDTAAARADHNILWADLKKTLESRWKALELYWKEDWDYFELVITGTDRLHHYLWKAGFDPNHPEHEAFLNYYRELDGLIGHIAKLFEAETGDLSGLFLLSDHGFGELKKEVYLNAWLKELGLLRFSTSEPASLSELQESSVAFALDPSRIYLNLRGKFPKGKVAPSERNRWREEIKQALLELTYSGEKVIRQVYYAEEVYSGPLTSCGPDLIALPFPRFDLKGSVKKHQVFLDSDLEGMHTYDDAFFWTTQEVPADLKIAECSQIIINRLLQ